MSDKVNVQCPKCGGAQMWDNRLSKKNPKAPDMKCVDKNCDGVIWPPKNGAPTPTPQASNGKQAFSSGPHIPAIDGPRFDMEKLETIFALYGVCVDHVLAVEIPKLMKADIGSTPEAVSAMAATLLIQAVKAA